MIGIVYLGQPVLSWGRGAVVKELIAFITDSLQLLLFIIIADFSDYSKISVVFLYGLTYFQP